MPSKPPKLVITVSGPLDSGKTHLLIKLREFLAQTYGSEIRVKADALLLTRYDGHEHGPARPHRGTEIELRSETVGNLKLVIDPHQPGIVPELIIHSAEHQLTVYRDTQRVYTVHGVARKLVANLDLLPPAAREWAINALGTPHTTEAPRKFVASTDHHLSMNVPRCTIVDTRTGALVKDWGTLSEEAFDWALEVMRANDCAVMADLHEFKRRPWLIDPTPEPTPPQEEKPVTKLFQPRRTWLTRLKSILLRKPQTSFTLEELKVTPDAPREQMFTAPASEAFVDNVSEPRRVPTGVEPHYGAASHKLKPKQAPDDFTMVPGERNEVHELIAHYDTDAKDPTEQRPALPEPIEVDDYTLTLDARIEDAGLLEHNSIMAPDDGGLTVNELLMEEVVPEAAPHDVDAATQEVIDRLGGIVPHHHGHARKVMPLEGPTGKKSNYNVRNQKPHGKKKPRR